MDLADARVDAQPDQLRGSEADVARDEHEGGVPLIDGGGDDGGHLRPAVTRRTEPRFVRAGALEPRG